MVTFTVYGAPIPKGSAKAFARIGRDNRTGEQRAFAAVTHDNPRTKSWQAQVSEEAVVAVQTALMAGDVQARCAKGPIRLEMHFFMPRPKYIKAGMPPHLVKPDSSKLARCAEDGLTGICFQDDAQVVELYATKQYAQVGDRPRAVIAVVPL